MTDNRVNMPSGFGGLMRFQEEYESKINLKPTHVVAFVVFVVILRVALGMIYS